MEIRSANQKTGRIAEERRAQILKAAAACFGRRGFHLTSMAEVCAEANISPGSVYRYFRSKEEIIIALSEQEREQIEGIFAEAETQPTLEAALHYCGLAFDEWLRSPESLILWLEMLAEAARNPHVKAIFARTDQVLRERLGHLFQMAKARGEIDPELDVDQSVKMLIAIYDGMMTRRSYDELDSERFQENLSLLLRRFLQLGGTNVG
ncbi:MAG: TetR/AcrR family transcriptional regulator [Capsulimonadales bacterium]|nr:TetR/AcrR family transcriptional regulator [Capsulimonadales bacterium]